MRGIVLLIRIKIKPLWGFIFYSGGAEGGILHTKSLENRLSFSGPLRTSVVEVNVYTVEEGLMVIYVWRC